MFIGFEVLQGMNFGVANGPPFDVNAVVSGYVAALVDVAGIGELEEGLFTVKYSDVGSVKAAVDRAIAVSDGVAFLTEIGDKEGAFKFTFGF